MIEIVKTPVPTPELKRGLSKLTEAEGRSSQGLGARGRALVFTGSPVSVWGDGKLLAVASGDGHTAL